MSVDTDLIEQIWNALRVAKLEAVVVGNAASALHGAPITTEDVDVLVRDTALNRKKLLTVVDELQGSNPFSISDMTNAKRILLPESYLDVLFGKMGGGLTFESVRSRGKVFEVGTAKILAASLEDVIKSKRAANRKKDRAVLPILEDTLAVSRRR